MRYERGKEFIAILSMISVLITILAAIVPRLVLEDFNEILLIIPIVFATIIAAFAATMNIALSRKLSYERKRRKVFLIYAHEDIEAAKNLSSKLKQEGYNPWLDIEQIAPGQIWPKAIIRGIEESAVALVLISEHINENGFIQRELKVALETMQERGKDVSPVIPVRLDESPVPAQLAHIHWVNLKDQNGFEYLLSGLKKALAPEKAIA